MEYNGTPLDARPVSLQAQGEEPLEERVNPMHNSVPDADASGPPSTGNRHNGLSSTRSRPRRLGPGVVRAETKILQVWQTFVVKCIAAEDGKKVMKG